MKYLNLTKGFDPYNKENTVNSIKYESFFFSGGEPHVKLDMSTLSETVDVLITTRLNNMNDFGMLAVVTEALQQSGKLKNLHLFAPYFPGARQDRRMVDGEPLTVRVFAYMINAMKFDSVEIFDPHSDVTPSLIDNCEVIDNHKFVENCIWSILTEIIQCELINKPTLNIISPDAGANKKAVNLVKSLYGEHPINLIKCDKTRNVTNGNITGFEVYADNLQGKDCIIVDDIYDGGGTFNGLAEELKLKNAGDLYLIVSHGLFSKGFKELYKHFKAIYTTDSWQSNFDWEQKERDNTEICKIIPFNTFI